jgi:serine/threonine protein kinase
MATLSNSGFTRRSAFSGNSEGSHPRRPDQSEAGKNPVKAPIHVDAEKTPSAHFDFISFLMTAQRCGIPFLPINYNDELPRVGEGGDGIIREFQVTSKTKFVFKSTKLKSGDGAEDFKIQERRIYRALQEEIIILANSEIRHHPNIVQLEGICWDVAPKTALGRVLPVLVYERAPFGDLSSFLEETGRAIGTQSRMDLCFEIGQGLAIMHTKRGFRAPSDVYFFSRTNANLST